jgi:hypothetical protein
MLITADPFDRILSFVNKFLNNFLQSPRSVPMMEWIINSKLRLGVKNLLFDDVALIVYYFLLHPITNLLKFIQKGLLLSVIFKLNKFWI